MLAKFANYVYNFLKSKFQNNYTPTKSIKLHILDHKKMWPNYIYSKSVLYTTFFFWLTGSSINLLLGLAPSNWLIVKSPVRIEATIMMGTSGNLPVPLPDK